MFHRAQNVFLTAETEFPYSDDNHRTGLNVEDAVLVSKRASASTRWQLLLLQSSMQICLNNEESPMRLRSTCQWSQLLERLKQKDILRSTMQAGLVRLVDKEKLSCPNYILCLLTQSTAFYPFPKSDICLGNTLEISMTLTMVRIYSPK